MKRKILFISIIFITICGICLAVYATSKRGSTGSEVRQIQEKLKRWGYYKGATDGIYGSKTEEAVKRFQKANGLTVDGIIGPITWRNLMADVVGRGASGSTVN